MAREDFEGQAGAGGKFAAYEFEVTGATFQVVPEYMEGNTYFLHWVGNTSIEDTPQMTMETYHPSFALGSDWVSVDGGKTVQYQGSSRRPKLGKRYGMMLERVFDITKDINPDPLADIDPKVAGSWVGTKWFIERFMHDYKGQIGQVEVELPTQFLGKSTVQATPVTAVTTAPAPIPDPATVPPTSNGDLRGTLVALAQASATFEDFRGQALTIPNVTTDPALVQEILDQANGIFAQAKA